MNVSKGEEQGALSASGNKALYSGWFRFSSHAVMSLFRKKLSKRCGICIGGFGGFILGRIGITYLQARGLHRLIFTFEKPYRLVKWRGTDSRSLNDLNRSCKKG